MKSTLKTMSLEEWKKRNPDVMETIEDCDECGGAGSHSCDCGDEHTCGYCDGSGKLTKETIESVYLKQKAKDEKKLDKWLERAS